MELRKDHRFCQNKKFGISQLLQVLMCFVGQNKVFNEASEIFMKFLCLEVNAMQIQRVCEYYGSVVDKAVERNIESVIPKLDPCTTPNEDPTYVMIDGSMLFTRDEMWKETKLARVVRHSSNVEITPKRKEIAQSIYVSHLGGIDKFFPKLERHLTGYKNKVIIGDGAKWIWRWAEDNYPGAIQILDYYHAKEKLVLLVNHCFKDDKMKSNWVKTNEAKLSEDQVEEVIRSIKQTRPTNEEGKSVKEKTLSYYLEHEDKMLYKTYRDKGLLIGSGPIEAAHRSVLQCRMKLSGQKWSVDGANAMANLRCYYKSGHWSIIEKIIKAA